jgi:N-acetylneuraminate synthase
MVAEISSNHRGDKQRAFDLILAAKTAGADAVKFQVYEPAEIAANVIIPSGPWQGRNYRGLYADGYLPQGWLEELFTFARSIGIVPFASPFSESAVDFLETINCPIYKIASPEIVHHRLISHAAKTGKPLIISTGMAELDEIFRVDEIARSNGATDITYLHCISAYPASAADFNLAAMVKLRGYGFNVGLSDHSLDHVASVCAVALGAIVIEKHFTLSVDDGGSDAKFSLEPKEFEELVYLCREAAATIGEVKFGCREAEQDSYQYRRSIWMAKDVKAGDVITESDLAILRPNYGAHPANFDIFVGMKARSDLKAGTPLFGNELE